jgi:hypothetical protein
VVDVLDCRPFRRSDAKAAWCGHAPGLFAWRIELLHWTTAVPITGRTKLFHVDDILIRRASRAPAWLFEPA